MVNIYIEGKFYRTLKSRVDAEILIHLIDPNHILNIEVKAI